MARSHARFELALFSSDRDPDLAALSKDAKLLYVVLVTDPALNHAGVVLLRTGVWAEEASLDDDEFDLAFCELEKTQFTVVDRRTCELLVRSFIRSDGVAAQPNVLKGALSQAQQTRSRIIRRALAAELRRLPPPPPPKIGKNGRPVSYPDPHACAALLDPDDSGPGGSKPSSNSSRNPTANPSGNPSPNPSSGTLPGTLDRRDAGRAGGRGRGRGEGHLPNNSSSEDLSSSAVADPAPAEPAREDVEQLCARLRDRIIGNGLKTPTITAEWRRHARLLLDTDKRDLTQALRLIDWCQADPFWQGNVLSLPKFRKQYDQLLVRARQEQQRRTGGRPTTRTTDEKRAAIPDLVDEVLRGAVAGTAALRPDLRALPGGGDR